MAYVRANAITLSKNRTFVSYDFELTEDIDNLEIVVKYNGKGDFKINNISIKENNNILKRRLVYLFFIFIMLDVMYFFNRKIRTNKKIILIILGITFCISLPLFYRGMNIGHDGMFHQVRIDGIAEELSYGNFPVRIQSLWMEGYGYPISVYYGDRDTSELPSNWEMTDKIEEIQPKPGLPPPEKDGKGGLGKSAIIGIVVAVVVVVIAVVAVLVYIFVIRKKRRQDTDDENDDKNNDNLNI